MSKNIVFIILMLLTTFASAATNGTYVLEDGSYTVNVEFGNRTLTTIEPNRRATYIEVSPGVYDYINTNYNNRRYRMTVIDDRTIEASKPDMDSPPTRLVLAKAPDLSKAVQSNAEWNTIAQKYMALTSSDPDNIQSWTACANAALGRSHLTQAAADSMVRDNIAILRDTFGINTSPCPEILKF